MTYTEGFLTWVLGAWVVSGNKILYVALQATQDIDLLCGCSARVLQKCSIGIVKTCVFSANAKRKEAFQPLGFTESNHGAVGFLVLRL